MIEREVSERTLQKEHTMDIVKDVVGWIVVTVLAFVYWLVMLLFASLVLISIWSPTFDQLLKYSVVLGVICSLAYLIYILNRRFRKDSAEIDSPYKKYRK